MEVRVVRSRSKLVTIKLVAAHPRSQVGRVTFQHPVDAAGDARVDFDLHEMAEGWAADEAIKRGGLSELSLKHFVDTQTGAVWPTEVSLVIKGDFFFCARVLGGERFFLQVYETEPQSSIETIKVSRRNPGES